MRIKRKTKTQDFGKKIGGARKDLYSRGISIEDYDKISDYEKSKYMTKKDIWGKIDYQALVDEGRDKIAVFFIKKVKDSLPARPYANTDAVNRCYIEYINLIKKELMNVRTEKDATEFFGKVAPKIAVRYGNGYVPMSRYQHLLNAKSFSAMQVGKLKVLQREMERKQFLFTGEEKHIDNALKSYKVMKFDNSRTTFRASDGSSHTMSVLTGIEDPRGIMYVYLPEGYDDESGWKNDTYYIIRSGTHNVVENNIPTLKEAQEKAIAMYEQSQEIADSKKIRITDKIPYLTKLKRIGPQYNKTFKSITPDDIQNTFNFYGGQFGNYETEADRQKNLDLSYDAFCDLAKAIGISVRNVTFDGRLGISYGARGRGGKNGGIAHYELSAKTINLTKVKGGGSLAHEWGHALDHYLFDRLHPNEPKTGREPFLSYTDDPIFADVMDTMLYKDKPIVESDSYSINPVKAQALEDRMYAVEWLTSLCGDYSYEERCRIIDAVFEFQMEEYVPSGVGYEHEVTPALDKLMKQFKEITGLEIDVTTRKLMLMNQERLTELTEKSQGITYKAPTEYYENARRLDKAFRKSRSYYTKREEMFARAFACYVKDRLEQSDQRNDYLCGHADVQIYNVDYLSRKIKTNDLSDPHGYYVYASPMGEERERINREFDKAFEKMKEKGIFRSFDEKEAILEGKTISFENDQPIEHEVIRGSEQLSLFDFPESFPERD